MSNFGKSKPFWGKALLMSRSSKFWVEKNVPENLYFFYNFREGEGEEGGREKAGRRVEGGREAKSDMQREWGQGGGVAGTPGGCWGTAVALRA